MLQNRRNRVLIAIIAVLLVLLGMLATTAFSRKVLDPDVFALGSNDMPGIGDYVSLGDLEVRVDEVDKEDQAEAEKTTAGYRTILGGGIPMEAITGCLSEPRTQSEDDEDFPVTVATSGDTDLVLMKVTLRNNGDSPVDFRQTTPPTMSLQTVNGTTATPACGILVEAAPDEQVVEPGGAMPGLAAYRVPSGEEPGWGRWTDPDTGQTATTDVGGGEDAPGTCEAANLDLSETEFGAYLAALELPLADSGFTHLSHLRVVDNQFDPCAELSWVTVTGMPMRDTRGDPYDNERAAVVFFTGEHLADFKMSVDPQVSQVRRTGPGEVTMSYNAYRDDPDPTSVTYTAAGASDPDEPPLANGYIDFDHSVQSSSGRHVPLPYGNVHTAGKFKMVPPSYYHREFRAVVGEFSVICSVTGDPHVTCHRESGTWSFPDGAGSDGVDATFLETTAASGNPHISIETEDSWGGPRDTDLPTIPPGTRALVFSSFIVDTTDGTLRMFMPTPENERVLQLDNAQVRDLPLENGTNPYGLDTSRWA
ncbi:LppP/LprE family lipoprotein [Corynebacterium frankenforstense]